MILTSGPRIHTDWMMWHREAATTIGVDERDRRHRRPSSPSTTRPAEAAWSRSAAGWWASSLVVIVLNLLGVDVVGWLQDLWDEIKDVPPGYIVAGLVFQTGQTLFAGLSYYGILRAAYPGHVEFWPIATAYAVGVAMNNFLPANIGTFATLRHVHRDHPGRTFAGALAAYLVQKIFFTIAGTFVYLYLFLSVPGSFDENLGNLSDAPSDVDPHRGGRRRLDRDPRPHLLESS